MEDYICHYGRKGMKWYQHVFTKARNIEKDREKSDGDYIIRKNTKFTRYSPVKKIETSQYMSNSKWDRDMYMDDAINNRLGFKNIKTTDIYKLTIKNIDPVKCRTGSAVIEDILKEHGNKSLRQMFTYLKNRGYLDEDKSAIERWKIVEDNNRALTYRAKLATHMHDTIYKDRDRFIKKYRDLGYQVIKDPEDLLWNYESAKIIADVSHFKVSDYRKLTESDEKRIRKKFGEPI